MRSFLFYTAGNSDALAYAKYALQKKGVLFADTPEAGVTHLLLDVPSFAVDGSLRGGGCLQDVLRSLPASVAVFGGRLQHPELRDYKTVDLLDDALYVAENARITAHCAVKEALDRLAVTLWNCPVLVIGWGRIGKCLAALLKNMGAIVTVAARRPSDRALAAALGYDIAGTDSLAYSLARFRLIYNTVPAPVLCAEALQNCCPDCVKIDLASVDGMDADDVIRARGLPSKYAPESSGELIARTVLRLR